MFDLVLLSRCERIVSGHSGFAIQAATISNKSVDNHLDLIPPAEVVALTRADLAVHGERYDSTHRAFAWWAAYYGARHELSYDEGMEMVGAALEADPTNPRYRLRLAALCYRHGHVERGDAILIDALVADVSAGGKTLESVMLFSLLTVAGYDSLEVFEDFEHATDDGSGPAAIYRAALRAQRGNADGARADLATFRAYAVADDRLAVLGRLDAMVEATISKRSYQAGRPA